MRILPSAIVALAVAAPLLVAADDLTVINPDPHETPPRKLLHTFLLGECQKHFDARKAEVEKLKTPADIAARQDRLRKQFIDALDGFPERTPLNPRVVGTLKRDGYRIEKVVYESRPDHHVTANLYVPDGDGPFPGVLMPIGHSQNGKAAEYVQRGCVLMVKNGFVVLTYDPIGQGERSQLLDRKGQPAIRGSTSEHTMCGVGALPTGRSTASYRVWDGIRSIDYLASRSEVDAKRIGCTGCSGGGTLTSYLMALDDRIWAAAPSCYLTSLERLFATIGPQDAEQNITGQVAFGLDHADYIFLRAPKPTLICAATRDFFDIQGTWATFREAKRIYGLLGEPEYVDLIESDTGHGYPRQHREAVTRFFNHHLRSILGPVTERDFPIEKDADLWCTRTGQVIDDLKGRSVFDLNAERATELAKRRTAKAWKPDEFRHEVARLIGLPAEVPAAKVAEVGTAKVNGFDVRKLVYQTQPGIAVPAVEYRPPMEPQGVSYVVYVHDGGKAAAPRDQIELMATAGHRAVVIDLRGYGETAPSVAAPGKVPAFGVESRESFLSLHLNRPLLGQRVYDLLAVLKAIDPKTQGVEMHAYGSAAPVALHAAALDTRVRALALNRGLASWDLVARTPVNQNQLASVVPGALKVYDLPDLAASLAPRPLTIAGPVDPVGQTTTPGTAHEWYKPAVAAYKAAGAERQFRIVNELK